MRGEKQNCKGFEWNVAFLLFELKIGFLLKKVVFHFLKNYISPLSKQTKKNEKMGLRKGVFPLKQTKPKTSSFILIVKILGELV